MAKAPVRVAVPGAAGQIGYSLLFIWALCHHLCAGIRYLLLDIHIGIELRPARYSSALVIVAGLLLTAFFGARLW